MLFYFAALFHFRCYITGLKAYIKNDGHSKIMLDTEEVNVKQIEMKLLK